MPPVYASTADGLVLRLTLAINFEIALPTCAATLDVQQYAASVVGISSVVAKVAK